MGAGLMLRRCRHFATASWHFVRRLSGDDAYERYLRQHAEHGHEEPPLSRKEFFKQWQDGKWKGIKRCC